MFDKHEDKPKQTIVIGFVHQGSRTYIPGVCVYICMYVYMHICVVHVWVDMCWLPPGAATHITPGAGLNQARVPLSVQVHVSSSHHTPSYQALGG